MTKHLPFLLVLVAAPAAAQPPPDPVPEPVPEPVPLEDVEPEIFTARLYGYIDSRIEKSTRQPGYDGATAVKNVQPVDFDIPNFHVMLQGNLYGKYRFFLNLASPGSGSPTEDATVNLRNAWVELPLYRDHLVVRAGKTYRRFGLYNEILDAVPTFIGIEPPEMFDSDHLMLTRTTNVMVHGKAGGDVTASYALFTGADERAGNQLPLGADLRFDIGGRALFGGSLYHSMGDASPTTDVGGGTPAGGVAQWMASDRFQVYSVFGQYKDDVLTLQAEYTLAVHRAERDPERVLALENTSLSTRQRAYFGVDGDPQTTDDMVRTDAEYEVHAAYVRAGYEFPAGSWTLTPYGQFDYYLNPELIADEDFGGDNEAGLADGGKKYKSTAGIVARPADFVAVKLDVSAHTQPFDGETFTYIEGRLSLSLYWELAHGQ
jgi:hypothetical protein